MQTHGIHAMRTGVAVYAPEQNEIHIMEDMVRLDNFELIELGKSFFLL